MAQQKSMGERVKVFESWSNTYNESIVTLMQEKFGTDYREVIRAVVQAAGVKPGDNVLDIATGTGTVAIALAKSANCKCLITGIDITESMLDTARKNVAERGMPEICEFKRASAEELPFEGNTFDVVTTSLALHHTNVRKVLSEVRRVLKSGGKAAIGDVTANNTWRSMAGFMFRLFDQFYMFGTRSNDLFCQFYTKNEWLGMMQTDDFKDINARYFPPKHSWSRGIIVISGNKE